MTNQLRRIALLIEYDGTDFVGWQAQENGRSVQVVVESAVKEVFHEKRRVVGAGRTDSGVHATGQVAHVELAHSIPAERLADALNTKLPRDVQILASKEQPSAFHARRDARRRTYRYYLRDGGRMPVIDRRRVAWIPYELDEAAMGEAARHWIGRHDFSAFRAARCQAESAVRSIERFDVARIPGELVVSGARPPILCFTVTAKSFLHNQVRIMAGTLIEIGRGVRPPEWAREVLASKARPDAGPTAPACGLVLESVEYPEEYRII